MPTLTVTGLKHTYQDGMKKKTVLKGIDAKFETGKFYCILGESGSGKTTLLSLIAGLEKLQHGEIMYEDLKLSDIGHQKYRLNYVNIIFQAYNLIPYMTAVENIMVALDLSKIEPENKTKKEYAYEILEGLGIDRETGSRVVTKLSGGEQQRVAIARALCQDVPLIMADEPTGNLDEDTEEIIINKLKELAKSGKCVVVVTHSKAVAKQADIIYKIKGGQIEKK